MSQNKSDDTALVLRAQKGDRTAFAELVKKYHRLINVLVFCHTRNPQETRDLVQEVFLAALEGINNIENPSRFRYWIMQIGRGISRNWISRHHEMDSLESVDLQGKGFTIDGSSDYTPDERATSTESRGWALRALDRLNSRYKNVILLKYMEGATYEEIAGILDVSVATVRSRLYRAKAKLQRILRARVPNLEKDWAEHYLAVTPDMSDADIDYSTRLDARAT